MTRNEFLEKLRAALGNDLSGSIIQENINYYNQYINGEVSKGRSEQEVIEELGDPWVLARTIIEVSENQTEPKEEYQQYGYGSRQGNYSSFQKPHSRGRLSGIWKLLLVLLGIIGIFAILVAVVGGIISLLAPLIFPLLFIIMLIRILRQRRR